MLQNCNIACRACQLAHKLHCSARLGCCGRHAERRSRSIEACRAEQNCTGAAYCSQHKRSYLCGLQKPADGSNIHVWPREGRRRVGPPRAPLPGTLRNRSSRGVQSSALRAIALRRRLKPISEEFSLWTSPLHPFSRPGKAHNPPRGILTCGYTFSAHDS